MFVKLICFSSRNESVPHIIGFVQNWLHFEVSKFCVVIVIKTSHMQ